jgi:manganese/zinc/iron transport system permease protein
VKEYAVSGVVYPLMLSMAFVLVSILTVKVQLDIDAVLMGELAFAPLNRLVLFGDDIGAVAAYQAGGMAAMNIILTLFFYRNIKIALFDEGHASAMGMQPRRFQYALSIALSFTVVVSFESVGAIMVAGFIIGPAVIAMQLTKRLWLMLILASIAGIAATFCGYWLAHLLNASIIGSIMVVLGLFFVLAFILGANGGLLAQRRSRKSKQDIIHMDIFLVHLWQHELAGDTNEENSRYTIAEHLNWTNDNIIALIQAASKQDYLLVKPDGILQLLPRGTARAIAAVES